MIIGIRSVSLLKQTRDISFAYFSLFFFVTTVFTQESNSLVKSSKPKTDFFHHPPKVIFHSRPFDLEVFSEFPKNDTEKISIFYRTDAQPRYIEKTFDLASQRHIFSYNPKDRPTKKFSYFFTIELKNGSVYATPIDNSGMVVPYIFEVEDPLEYYKKRSMKRD